MTKVFKVTFVSALPGETAYDKPTEKVTHGPYYLRGVNRAEVVRYVRNHYGPRLETAGRIIYRVIAPIISEDQFLRIMAERQQAQMLPGMDLTTGTAPKPKPVTTLKPRGDNGDNS